MNKKATHFYMFGAFRLDAVMRLLLRDGQPVSLPPKALETLIVLVENAGQLVEKGELMKKVWPDIFVEEGNLTKNIFVLRKLLGAGISGEEYIETIPKRGYRFVAATTLGADISAMDSTLPAGRSTLPEQSLTTNADHATAKSTGKRWSVSIAGILVVGVLVGMTIRVPKRQPSSTLDLNQRQLTFSYSENPVRYGEISPDGKYLVYADLKGIEIMVIETGETRTVPQPDGFKGERIDWQLFRWFPDGNTFLVNQNPPPERELGYDATIWTASRLGAPPRKLREMAGAESVSPDGSLIAFTTGPHDLWLMAPDGTQARKLFDMGENNFTFSFRWSPNGKRLAYIKYPEGNIESRDLQGGPPVTMLSGVRGGLRDYVWLPDGRIVYALKELPPKSDTCNLWEQRVDPLTGQGPGEPRRLTNWVGFCVDTMSASADGKRLAFQEWAGHASVYVADIVANGKRITPPRRLTLRETWNVPTAWTPDSKAVIFNSGPSSQMESLEQNQDINFNSRFIGGIEILEQRLDEDTPKRVVTGLASITDRTPLSPDGAWFLFTTRASEAQPAQVMRVSVAGGPPQFVMTGGRYGIRCAKPAASGCIVADPSPGGTQLTFTSFDPLKGQGRELTKFETDPESVYNWDLSPDATRIAVLKTVTGEIHILSLTGRPTLSMKVESISTSTFLDWTAGGQGLFVSRPTQHGFELLHLDLQGNTRALWEQEGSLGISALPSPDGRRVAIRGWNINSNMWMMENF